MKNQASVRATEFKKKYIKLFVLFGVMCLLVALVIALAVMKITYGKYVPETPVTQPSDTAALTGTPEATVTVSPTPTHETPSKNEIAKVPYTSDQMGEGTLIVTNAANPPKKLAAGGPLIVLYGQKDRVIGLADSSKDQLTYEAYQALNALFTDLPNNITTDKMAVLTNELKNNIENVASEYSTGLDIPLKFMIKGGASYPFGDGMVRAEATWVYENAYKYGLVPRYPDITGTVTTANHLRYVGKVHAKYMTENKLSLEAYVEELKTYNFNSPLVTELDGESYRVYYIPANTSGTTDIIYRSASDTETYGSIEVSGDNMGGFIVTQQFSTK